MPGPLMALLALFGRIWTLISSFKLFWATIRNWTELKEHLAKGEEILEKLSKHGWPDGDDVTELLDFTKFLLDKGFIDLPGIDEAVIIRQLDEVRTNLIEGLKPHVERAKLSQAKFGKDTSDV